MANRVLGKRISHRYEYNCLVGLVVLSATATLEVLGSIPRSSKSVIEFFYEILSSSSELGFVPS